MSGLEKGIAKDYSQRERLSLSAMQRAYMDERLRKVSKYCAKRKKAPLGLQSVESELL